MAATIDDRVAALERANAELRRQLDARTAELKEALDQQTATAEVLQVINASPGDLAPVFDAMLEKALRLCEAVRGQLATFDGEAFEFVALKGDPHWLEQRPRGRLPASRGLTWSRIVAGEPYVHILDALDTEAYRSGHQAARDTVIAGGRTFLTVALRREQALLGALTVYRQEVRPFTDKQIALLQNFAAQAVIAMENARLLGETREALEQQTATAEVLQVINSSPGDLAPVFDAILEKAHALCGVAHGSLHIYDGDKFRAAAVHNLPDQFVAMLRQGFRGSTNPVSRPILDGARLVHIADLAEIEDPTAQSAVKLAGIRTALFLPLRRDDVLLGMIVSARREVRQFSEKEISLLENFAAQAVIAMENARLLTETREGLEQQTATAEILQVINASPGDLASVFDTMLERAMRLCGAEFGEFFTTEGERLRAVAVRGAPTAFAEFRHRNPAPPAPGSITARILAGEPVIHVVDVKDDDLYRRGDPHRRALVDLGGARTFLSVTLLKERAPLGSINIYRQEVRPFSDKEIALLQNFAAQAVIAMENARLLTETREALEQQTATAEVLQVINSSPGDLAPVFDAILEKAHSLCGIALGELELYEGGKFHAVAVRGVSGPFAELLRQPFVPPPASPLTQLLAGAPIVQIADLSELARERPDDPRAQAGVQHGLRTVLFVPLRKDGALLGYITAYRREVRPFSDKEIVLLQNFAAQAVIAMENTRLIRETREALEQQTATAEVLQVINSSPGDLAPVFEAMLERAMHLCEAAFGEMHTFDSGRFAPAVLRGVPAEQADFRKRNSTTPSPGTITQRIVQGMSVVHVADLMTEEVYRAGDPQRRSLVDLGGARTALAVALRKDDALFGLIMIYRQEVRPFSDKQIALLQNVSAI